ncbi:MAG: ribonuclease Z [Candidatus Marinimicrobia bacterium]|nr:ribonuclease Z [Candidatus Neomarinimicrobiota bacterium]
MLESIQFLGYSGGVPTTNSSTSSCVIDIGGSFVLVDCAENTFINLIKGKYPLGKIHSIFITHLHPDHMGGLIPFLFYKHVIRNQSEITLYGPDNLESYLKTNFEYQGFNPSYPINVINFSRQMEYQIQNDFTIKALMVVHGLPCFAYRFYDGNKSLTYVTDTRKFDQLYKFAQDTDLLVLESTFPDGMEQRAHDKFHLSISDALEIAKTVNAKRLILTHFSPRIGQNSLSNVSYNGHPCFIGLQKTKLNY